MSATTQRSAKLERGAAFANLLINARHQRGWSQDTLAREANLNRTTVIRWESGDAVRPGAEVVRNVCEVLEIPYLDALTALGTLTTDDRIEDVDSYVARVLAEAPPMSDEAIAFVASILGPGVRASMAERAKTGTPARGLVTRRRAA